ncbi:MAG: VOC family protein [Brevefilum sp.]|nr:VOC family protein [Brevefilum sp.]
MSLSVKPKIQIILYVKNMAEEVRFYRDVLGLTIRYPQDLADYSDQMWVELEIGDATLSLHGGADGNPQDDHEIVFTVDDIVQVRGQIIEAGINMREIRPLEDGAPISEGKDPDGHRFAIRG